MSAVTKFKKHQIVSRSGHLEEGKSFLVNGMHKKTLLSRIRKLMANELAKTSQFRGDRIYLARVICILKPSPSARVTPVTRQSALFRRNVYCPESQINAKQPVQNDCPANC